MTASAASKSRIASLFPADEYADVWSSSPSSSPSPNSRRIPPLLCPELDRPTRFLLSLLDDSINGIRRGKDKATTARCHRQLKRLADTSIGGRRLDGRAKRADEILIRMEKILFIDGGANSGNDASGSNASASTTTSTCTSGDMGGISGRGSSTTKRSMHAPQHKYERPLPNRQTYLMVLRLHAQSGLAIRAEAIVAGMELASEQLGDLSLRPRTVAYNQVIAAWAASTDPSKAYRAATVLATLKAMDLADASSYGHVLRACATTAASSVDAGDDDELRWSTSQQTALKIAMGLWKDLDSRAMKRRTNADDDDDNANEENGKSDLLLSSHFYTFLLRVLGFMPASKPLEKDAAISKAFKNCCRDGMVNAHVLQALYSVASKRTCGVLGDRLASQAEGAMKTISGAAILAQKVPDAWTRKAVVANSWGW